MARPYKKGIDYFPLDCKMDKEFEFIEARFGLKGFAVVIKLYQKIYGENGYYLEWSDDVGVLFANEINVGGTFVSEIIEECFKRGIFSRSKYEEYGILTSMGIQKRYLQIARKREEKNLVKEYLLISCTQKKETDVRNFVLDGRNAVMDGNNQQIEREIYSSSNKRDFSHSEEKESFLEYYFKNVNAMPGQVVIQGITEYESLMPFCVYKCVIDYCIGENKRNWRYIEAVLKSYVMKRIKTEEEFYRDMEKFKNRTKKEENKKIITTVERNELL